MKALAGMLLWITVAAVAFHTAYASASGSFLIVLYLFALLQLAQTDRWRKAFYSGLAVGLLIAAVRLTFSPAASAGESSPTRTRSLGQAR